MGRELQQALIERQAARIVGRPVGTYSRRAPADLVPLLHGQLLDTDVVLDPFSGRRTELDEKTRIGRHLVPLRHGGHEELPQNIGFIAVEDVSEPGEEIEDPFAGCDP